jgi:hypothetical protein
VGDGRWKETEFNKQWEMGMTVIDEDGMGPTIEKVMGDTDICS